MNVESIMSKNVQVCRSNQTAQSAIRLMRDHDCGSILIVNKGAVVGIVTDRDIALAASDADKAPSQLRLSQIMSGDPVTVHPDTSLTEAESLMRENQVRRVPVVDEDQHPVGLLSLNDIARAGASRSWKEDGLTARNIASTLAAICGPKSSTMQARA
jgi:CBS domain-containing protein